MDSDEFAAAWSSDSTEIVEDADTKVDGRDDPTWEELFDARSEVEYSSRRRRRRRGALVIVTLVVIGLLGTAISVPLAAESDKNSSNASGLVRDLVHLDGIDANGNPETMTTGVVIGSSGLVVSSLTGLGQPQSVRAVDLGNGRSYSATMLGGDRTHDIELLRLVGASNLTRFSPPVGAAAVGDWVGALGVSDAARSIPSIFDGTVKAVAQSVAVDDPRLDGVDHLRGVTIANVEHSTEAIGEPLLDATGGVVGLIVAPSSSGLYAGTMVVVPWRSVAGSIAALEGETA